MADGSTATSVTAARTGDKFRLLFHTGSDSLFPAGLFEVGLRCGASD